MLCSRNRHIWTRIHMNEWVVLLNRFKPKHNRRMRNSAMINICNLFIFWDIEYDKLYLRHLKATVHNRSLHLMMELGMVRHVHIRVCVQHVLKMLLMKIVCGWVEQHLWASNRFIGWWWLTWTRCTTVEMHESLRQKEPLNGSWFSDIWDENSLRIFANTHICFIIGFAIWSEGIYVVCGDVKRNQIK